MQIGAGEVKGTMTSPTPSNRSMLEQEIPCIHSSVISFELVCTLETLLKELLYLQKYKFFSIVFSGNGPSGICLSYLLSGYTPYFKRHSLHPHPILQRKLEEAPEVSVLDQVRVKINSMTSQ